MTPPPPPSFLLEFPPNFPFFESLIKYLLLYIVRDEGCIHPMLSFWDDALPFADTWFLDPQADCSKGPNVPHTKPKDNPKMAKYVLIMQNGIL